MQTLDLRICCANLESTRNHLGSRNQISVIRGNKPTIDRASEASRPFAETKPQLIVCVKQFDLLRQRNHKRSYVQAARPSAATKHDRSRSRARTLTLEATMVNDCGFVATDGEAALRAQSIVGSLPRMAKLLCERNQSWVCCHGWPRFGCAILDDCVWIRGLHARS